MKTSEFYFDLPEELIAQEPLKDRSSSRLLVADKNTESISHRHFRDIKEYLKAGDCLVSMIPEYCLQDSMGNV